MVWCKSRNLLNYSIRIPLPFRMVKNQRSMIGIDNLVDLLIKCVDHPNATGKTFWFRMEKIYLHLIL